MELKDHKLKGLELWTWAGQEGVDRKDSFAKLRYKEKVGVN